MATNDTLRPGEWVSAEAYGGAFLARRVVAVEAGTIYICTDEEFRAARAEGREPVSVGFRPHHVRRGKQSAAGAKI